MTSVMPSLPVSWPIKHEPAEQATGCFESASPKQLPWTTTVQQEEIINLSKAPIDINADSPDTKSGGGLDIGWIPSFEGYMARVERLSKTQHARTTTLPPGFPERVETRRAWVGSDFAEEKSYIYVLSEAEVSEIEEALSYFKGLYTS